ncbi:MAG: hypothetical protein J2P20_13775, partial [Pseudonocardia sp.]|nr:hypothetical protein [Pseudonocardia sp.]
MPRFGPLGVGLFGLFGLFGPRLSAAWGRTRGRPTRLADERRRTGRPGLCPVDAFRWFGWALWGSRRAL